MALNILDTRMQLKMTVQTGGTIPTIGATSDHTDGSWSAEDIYPGEFYFDANPGNEKLFLGALSGIVEVDLFSTGSTDYDFCITGIKTSAISGCSPVTIYDASSFAAKFAYSSTTIGGNGTNTASGDYSSAVGGKGNTASGIYSNSIGGTDNSASGTRSFIGGGRSNTNGGTRSIIVGGYSNNIKSSASDAFVTGYQNASNASFTFVGGGSGNYSKSSHSSIVGGNGNTTYNTHSFIGAGISNLTYGKYSSIIGGKSNTASGIYSSIIGGNTNTASTTNSVVIGGNNNKVAAANSVILGGSLITGDTAETAYVPNLNIQVGKGISFGSGNSQAKKEIEIGDWDMDATTSINIAHGLTVTEWKTIRQIDIIIRDDSNSTYTKFNGGKNHSDIYNFNDTNIILERLGAGIFDSVNYDSTTYNRGWITITYTPD